MPSHDKSDRRGILILMEHLPNMRSLAQEDLGALMYALIDHVLGIDPKEAELPREAKLIFGYVKGSVDRMENEYRRKSHKPKSPPAAVAPQEGRNNAEETEQTISKAAALNNTQQPITNYQLPITHTQQPIDSKTESVFCCSVVRELFQQWLNTMEGIGYSVSDEIIQKQMDKLISLSGDDPEAAEQILKKAIAGKYRGFFRVGKPQPKDSGFDWGIDEQKEKKE